MERDWFGASDLSPRSSAPFNRRGEISAIGAMPKIAGRTSAIAKI
jgi:hypothetical protein